MSGSVRSAGLLPYRIRSALEVLIAHPGGPFFAGRDEGAWTILKGLIEDDEDERAAAAREFAEETGWDPPADGWIPLGETVMKSRKVVVAWGIEADYDPSSIRPGTFSLYGKDHPEIDEVRWTAPDEARVKLNPALRVFIDRLQSHLDLNEESS
jgi:predicted NUDIX family NTP pyrophosphohydrolase